MKTTVSVVIPLFNKKPHVARAIQSVLIQTRSPNEVVIVDDGSTDGGAEVVRSKFGSSVILISQPNRGVSLARNAGVQNTSGEYIFFLDADDWWLEDHIERLLRIISLNPEAGLLATARALHVDGVIYRHRSASRFNASKRRLSFLKEFSANPNLFQTSSVAVKRSCFEDCGGFPKGVRVGEDLILWLRVGMKSGFAYDPKVTAIQDLSAVNRSYREGLHEIPGAILFVDSLLEASSLENSEKFQLAKLHAKLVMYLAGEKISYGHLEDLAFLCSYLIEKRHWLLVVVVRLCALGLPRFFIDWVRSRRVRY